MISADALDSCVRQLSGRARFSWTSSPRRPGSCALGLRHVPRRLHGTSKLDSLVVWDWDAARRRRSAGTSVRFVAFTLVGGAGVLVHMAVLAALAPQIRFLERAGGRAGVAMIFNFWLNNLPRIAIGGCATRWITGLLSFMAACGAAGAVANVGIASYLFASHTVGGRGTGRDRGRAVWN